MEIKSHFSAAWKVLIALLIIFAVCDIASMFGYPQVRAFIFNPVLALKSLTQGSSSSSGS